MIKWIWESTEHVILTANEIGFVYGMGVFVCVVGASGPGRGGKKAHSVEGFSQITSASGGERGMLIHNASLFYHLHLTYLELAYLNLQLYCASM